MLGLRFCARALSSCGKWGPLFIAVRGPLTVVASLVAEHRLQTRRVSNHGSRAQPLRGMWDLPRPGLEPVSPALAGRLSTTTPPGKPLTGLFNQEAGRAPYLFQILAATCISWLMDPSSIFKARSVTSSNLSLSLSLTLSLLVSLSFIRTLVTTSGPSI